MKSSNIQYNWYLDIFSWLWNIINKGLQKFALLKMKTSGAINDGNVKIAFPAQYGDRPFNSMTVFVISQGCINQELFVVYFRCYFEHQVIITVCTFIARQDHI